MRIPPTYLLYFFILFSCSNRYNNNYSHLDTNSIFINWNIATLKSLKNQLELSKDSSTKNIYENRLLAFKSFIDIDKEEKVNRNSIRYKFIEELEKNANSIKDFYVFEANTSGENVEIRNYVIYSDMANNASVDIYNFDNGKWIKNATSKTIDLQLDSNLKNYLVKFKTGFNKDDVIITHFKNNTISDSEYYLYTTLSDGNSIKKILLLR